MPQRLHLPPKTKIFIHWKWPWVPFWYVCKTCYSKKFASGGFKLLEGSKLYTQNDSEYVYKASSLKKFAVGGFRRKQVTHQNSRMARRPILVCLEGLFSKTIASGGFRRKPFTHQEWLLEPSLYDWKAYFFLMFASGDFRRMQVAQ